MNEKEISLYQQEIDELTTLLNEEWLDLRDVLNKNDIETIDGRLISFFEDEYDGQFGLFITNKKEIIKFEVINNKMKKEYIRNATDIADEYPQILVALNDKY
ncbi:TPA: hypothetical protein ACOVI5_002021 [Klebsiella oxytoca]